MKLYVFRPVESGQRSFFVAAVNSNEAQEAVEDCIHKRSGNDGDEIPEATVDLWQKGQYTVEALPPRSVAWNRND